MMVQIDGNLLGVLGVALTILLAIIAYFMDRLIRQFDTLNSTVQKIDRDLTLDVGLVKSEHAALRAKVFEFEPIWDRLRTVENDVGAIKAGGCDVVKRCDQ